MAVLGRRLKSVSVRLSEQEYRIIEEVCESQGARCVSEGVRYVIRSLLGANGRGSRGKSKSDAAYRTRVNTTLVQLQGRLEDLDDELKSLIREVHQLLQANSVAEQPESTTTAPEGAQDYGLAHLTNAIGHAAGGRQPRKP